MPMDEINLSDLPWTVAAWRPFAWLWKITETSSPLQPDVHPIPARVPGSVQQALLDAGLIDDWHIGLKSRSIEWVEHRHWEFSCRLPAGALPANERIILDAQGLDYSGWILVDNRQVAPFRGALVTHRLELSEFFRDGQEHHLRLIFDVPPAEDGQTGFASRSKYFKPRYSYSWDWCPRIVPMGIWDTIAIKTGLAADCRLGKVRTELAENNCTGAVQATVDVGGEAVQPDTSLQLTITDGAQVVASRQCVLVPGRNVMQFEELPVKPWQPNGQGEPKTYQLKATISDGGQRVVWSDCKTIGFRRIQWRQCEGAPAGAEPWICVVNGKPVFLQGMNWTPVTSIYHDTTPPQYSKLISMYREMGCNLLRVWGGGYLEREVFYKMCDEAGLLVWQEFPLSASGVDNWPPEDPAAVADLVEIARSYIARRAHHPSLLLWCGGNELQGGPEGKQGVGRPVDCSHPAMAAMNAVVQSEDPSRRFVPTSASGPRFMADANEFGKGLHHDVHGPWCLDDGGMEGWKRYWDGDDALFRSEVGAPAVESLELLQRYAGDLTLWPPTGEYWMHSAAWWTQWSRFLKTLGDLPPDQQMSRYIEEFRQEQAQALAYAAERCKARFPRCGGFVLWMGHDCFPVPSNTAIIQFDRNPKPAYYALQKVFRQGSLTDPGAVAHTDRAGFAR